MSKKADLHRFNQHIEKDGECWVWKSRLDRNGYGEFKHEGVKHKAHRWIYEFFNGIMPTEVHIDHLCRNRRCVRLEHLEAVTAQENKRRGVMYR
jgi:hypothetical protein